MTFRQLQLLTDDVEHHCPIGISGSECATPAIRLVQAPPPTSRKPPAAAFRLRILGPFEAEAHGAPVELPRGQLRWLLASFCLEPGRLLPEHRLIEQVWGGEGGSTSALRSAVSRLRTWLVQSGLGTSAEITHRGTGYAMTLPQDMVDGAEAIRRHREALAGEQGPDSVDELLDILALWRDPVLVDAPSALRHHPAAVELDHLRGRCVIALVDAARAFGRCADVVDAIRQAVREAPFDEQLQAAFVIAALGAGRRTEALHHYATVCARIRTELGVEPSAELLTAISAADPARAAADEPPSAREPAPEPAPLSAPAPGLVPPPAAADFTGRTEALDRIVDSALDHTHRSTIYISGPPGIGKTELCLAATAEIVARGGARVLFAAMDGSAGRPRDPHAVMARFVGALDPTAPVGADDPHTLADHYRALLSAGPTVVVLDDVAGAEQVVPFLTPDPRCTVLATGRVAAPAVPGCASVDLCSFTEREAADFVAAIIGRARAASDPAALRRIHRLVDGHPLGLRIAALRLASNPHWSLSRMADLLSDPSTQLEVLRHDGLSMSSLLSDMVRRLDPAYLRDLQRLVGVGAPAPAGPAVIDRDAVPELADEALDRLHAARLIGFQSGSGPVPAIWLSSLVRTYAAGNGRHRLLRAVC